MGSGFEGAGTVKITNADKAVATFTASNRLAALTFNLTVTDSFGQTATDVVNVIAQPNRAPTANAGPDQTVDTETSVNLKGSGTDPDRADALTYSWEQMSGPTVSLGGKTSATAWFTAPATATALTFRLRVTDPHGAADTDTVTIRVVQTTPEEAVNKYDADGDGFIDKDEVIKAIQDYLFNGKASKKEVDAVIAQYNADNPDSDSELGPGNGSDSGDSGSDSSSGSDSGSDSDSDSDQSPQSGPQAPPGEGVGADPAPGSGSDGGSDSGSGSGSDSGSGNGGGSGVPGQDPSQSETPG